MRGSAQNPPAAQGDEDGQGQQRKPGDDAQGTGTGGARLLLVRLGTGWALAVLGGALHLLGWALLGWALLGVAVLGGSGTGGGLRRLLAVAVLLLGKVRRLGVVPVHRGYLGSGTPAVGAL